MIMVTASKSRIIVSAPPKSVPLLIYDGDCSFCRAWAMRFRRISKRGLTCAPYQEVRNQFPEIELSSFERAVQFIDLSGVVSEGAEATFRAMAISPPFSIFIWLYLHFPGMRGLSEYAYRLVSRNRNLLSFLE